MASLGARDEGLDAGTRALSRGDWQGALVAVEEVQCAERLDEARRLDVLAEALWWLGRMDECIEARQRAFATFEEADDHRGAGQAAIWLYEHHQFQARPAMATAWLRRARRVLDGDTDGAPWGHLLLREAELAHGGGELAFALDNVEVARELGRRLRDVDLEAEALQCGGRVLIDAGRAAEGLAHLDEAMLYAVEGRLRPYTTGKVYCSAMGAWDELGDLRRAAEWTDATSRWSEQHPFAVFPGLCRLKRAEVLQWRGDWAEAEREATRACEELSNVKVGSEAAAWVQIGEIRRRIGDLEGAERAFGRAQDLCCTPASGLALLRLAQGRLDAASTIIDSALADETWSRLARARLLPAKVQIALAADDLAGAQQASAELDSIAEQYGTPGLVAAALLARGRWQLAHGSARAACATLRQAVERWRELEVPYEVATANLLLGQACRAAGDRGGESHSLDQAASTFERLGALFDARRARSLVAGEVLPAGLSEREVEVLRLVALGRTNKEIAGELGLSQKTVARHLSNIFVKSGVTTRAGATAFAYDRGLVGANL